MAECDVQQLMTDGRCFACQTPEEQSTLELALLYQWAESTQTVQELMDSAECFDCKTPEEKSTLELQLLCEIAGGTSDCVDALMIEGEEITIQGECLTV